MGSGNETVAMKGGRSRKAFEELFDSAPSYTTVKPLAYSSKNDNLSKIMITLEDWFVQSQNKPWKK